jgi:hypothetical protein
MIEPTPGRIVWFRPPRRLRGLFGLDRGDEAPLAATIVYVHGTRRVNLCVYDANGLPRPLRDVQLRQDDDEVEESYAEWMPYQKAQVEKQGRAGW